MDMTDYVWYVSYGSNLWEKRFICYIQGGRPEGANRSYTGCRDRTHPIKTKNMEIDRQLYFAKSSKTWNQSGVAFIDPDRNISQTTLGRAYLITREQFMDVVKQENGLQNTVDVDLEEVRKKGSYLFKKAGWYNHLLYLNHNEGYPVYTFTREKYIPQEINTPGTAYLSTIGKGLRDSYKLSSEEIYNYFRDIPGIQKLYTAEELKARIGF